MSSINQHIRPFDWAKKLFLVLLTSGFATFITAQNTSINATGALPDSSAMLDVSDTTRGLLMPRMTTTQMNTIANPAEGLIIYNTTDSAFNYYDGVQWRIHDDTAKLPVSGGIMTGSIDMGANNIINAQYIVMNNGATLHYGNVNTAQQTTLVGGFGASDAGKTWYNSDSSQLALWDGTQVIYVTGGGATGDLNTVLNAGSNADNDSIINLAVLGIGTSSPDALLHANGDALPATGGRYGISSTVTDGGNGSTTIYGVFSNPTSGGGGSNTYYGLYSDASVTAGSSSSIGLYSKGSAYSAIFEGGPVGVGVTDPESQLQVDSSLSIDGRSAVKFYGYNIYYDGSDYRHLHDGIATAVASGDDFTGMYKWPAGTGGGIVDNDPVLIFQMKDSLFTFESVQSDTVVRVKGGLMAERLAIENEYWLPTTDGIANQVLQTDGSGNVNWTSLVGASTDTARVVADVDYDTKIQVEESNDEDVIRIDVGGTEYWTLEDGRINVKNTGESVFLGDGAGASEDLTTRRNTLVGYEAGTAMTSADHTVSVGWRAGHSLNAADENVFIGSQAGQETVGNRNVMVGRSAGQNNTGTRNVFLGSSAGKNNDGNQNVFIGYHVGLNLVNGVSNELHIHNNNTTTPLIWGDFADDSLTIHGVLSVDSAKTGTSGYTFPGKDGMAGQSMVTDGNGVLQWGNPGGWMENGNDLYTTFDSVGFGTTNPEYLVDIRSDQNIMLHLSPLANTGENASMVIQGARNGSTTQDNANIFLRNYDHDLTDWNNIAKISARVTNSTTNVGDLIFYNYADGATSVETMRLTKDGNMGLNVSAPIGDVHFNQDSFRISTPSTFDGAYMSIYGHRHNSGSAFATLDFRNYDSSDGAAEYSGARFESTNSGSSDDGDLRIYTTNDATSALAMIITKDGEVGIGTASPSSLFHLEDDGDAVLNIVADADNVNESDNPKIFMSQDGGTVNGFIGLEGTAGATATNTLSNAVLVGSEDNNPALQFVTDDAARMTILTSGDVGIGTNAPTANLHMYGTNVSQKFQSSASVTNSGNNLGVIGFHDNQTTTNQASIVVERDGASSGAGDVGTSITFKTTSDGSSTNTTRMVIEEDGDVGIDVASPTHILHINGQGRSSSTLWAITSDIRAKQNVYTISNATETLMKFRPVTYEWKPAFKEKYEDKRDYRYGFISQEVEQIIPEMINEIVETVENDTIEDFKLLDQEPLIPLLVKTVQEQQLEIERLNDNLEEKNGEIDEMKAMLNEFMRLQGVDPENVKSTVNQVAKKK